MVFKLFGLLACLALGGTPPSPSPNFECTDAGGNAYKIWTGKDRSAMQVIEKGVAREIPLSVPQIARPFHEAGRPLVYNGWNRNGRDLLTQLDVSTEFAVQYLVQDGSQGEKHSRIKVSLVLDHRERPGLVCKSLRYAASVVSADSEGSPAARYAEMVNEAAGMRADDGALTPAGTLEIDAAVRRMFNSPSFKQKEARAEFIKALTPGLVKVAPQTIGFLGGRFPAPIGEFWKTILDESRYQYFPETQRYTTWVVEGARPGPYRDLKSVRAGVAAFVRSPTSGDKNLRDLFASDVTPAIKPLSEREIELVKTGLDAQSTAFLLELWAKANGKRTLADYPDIEQMVAEIAAIPTGKEFDAMQAHKKIMAFFKSSMAGDPEARALFLRTASPQVKRLSPREREDVMGWLDENEKKLFAKLIQ